MEHLHAHNVVLGAGAMGSATAYHLAKRGEPVLLVEQFAFGHERGSSHGAARITRHSYADPRYARLMPEAFRAWRELEADAGASLYIRTGGVSVCPAGVDYVDCVAASLSEMGVPHRKMDGDEWSRLHPPFAIPATHRAVFEPDAGMLAAADALEAMRDRAQHFGGERTVLRPETPIHRIDLEAGQPTLLGDDLRITADRLIVTAGAWVGELLPALAATLRPALQKVFYFRPEPSDAFALGRFPVFIYKGDQGEWDAFYGMPGLHGTGVKVARHGGPIVDADDLDRTIRDEDREAVREFLQGFLPALGRARIDQEETCLYTMAPGDDFVVGPLPGRADVIVASPCSGHGFKFSCLIGRVLADLAIEGRSPLDLNAWRTPSEG